MKDQVELARLNDRKRNYNSAIKNFHKALEYLVEYCPTHPDLRCTYSALELMYSDTDDEEKVFEFIEKAHQL